MKKDKSLDPSKDPEFKFENPSPDLKASIDLNDRLLNLFLTSRGRDQSAVNTVGGVKDYSSALERHLAMIEKFEATADDLEVYHDVEQQVFNKLRRWSNELQGTRYPDKHHGLIPELQLGAIREDLKMSVKFARPEAIETKKELEESVIRRLERGLITEVEAVMELREVSEDEAIKVVERIRSENQPIINRG